MEDGLKKDNNNKRNSQNIDVIIIYYIVFMEHFLRYSETLYRTDEMSKNENNTNAI